MSPSFTNAGMVELLVARKAKTGGLCPVRRRRPAAASWENPWFPITHRVAGPQANTEVIEARPAELRKFGKSFLALRRLGPNAAIPGRDARENRHARMNRTGRNRPPPLAIVP